MIYMIYIFRRYMIYKWMHAPRACACLYTNGKRWPHIRAGSLNATLEFDGTIEAGSGMETQAIYAGIYGESTRDYSPFLTLPGALALLRWLKPLLPFHIYI
jgi:hypothetical protein